MYLWSAIVNLLSPMPGTLTWALGLKWPWSPVFSASSQLVWHFTSSWTYHQGWEEKHTGPLESWDSLRVTSAQVNAKDSPHSRRGHSLLMGRDAQSHSQEVRTQGREGLQWFLQNVCHPICPTLFITQPKPKRLKIQSFGLQLSFKYFITIILFLLPLFSWVYLTSYLEWTRVTLRCPWQLFPKRDVTPGPSTFLPKPLEADVF